MKTTSVPKLLLVLAGLLLAMPSLRAADETTTTPPAGEKGGRRERGPGGPGGPGAMMERAAKELGLSADQEAKWKEIGQQEKTALEALRADTSVAKEDKRAKMMELNKGFADQRRAVLTPDQATKFDEMRAKMRERGPRGDKGPKKEKEKSE